MSRTSMNPTPARRSSKQIERDHAKIAEFAPGLGKPYSTLDLSGMTTSGRMVAIYTPSVSQTASAVVVVTLNHEKGRFASRRSACVVGKRVIIDAVNFRGRRIESACVEARRQARLTCSVIFSPFESEATDAPGGSAPL